MLPRGDNSTVHLPWEDYPGQEKYWKTEELVGLEDGFLDQPQGWAGEMYFGSWEEGGGRYPNCTAAYLLTTDNPGSFDQSRSELVNTSVYHDYGCDSQIERWVSVPSGHRRNQAQYSRGPVETLCSFG